jgi:hypothetical protein
MTTRRKAVVGIAGLSASLGIKAAPPPGTIRYTAATAPDTLTREILTQRLTSFHHGTSRQGDPTPFVRRNTPQIIEQNLARLNGRRISALLSGMSDLELRTLAQVYSNAVHNSGRQARLHDLLALRVDGSQLGRVSRHLGFAPMYEAIHRIAPQKSHQFQEHSNPNFAAPVPGAPLPMRSAASLKPAAFKTDGTQAPQFIKTTGPTVEWTIYEIYLGFRTAPIGSLGPAAAAYQTTVYASAHLSAAFGGGYAVGTGISYLLQNYAPAVHDAIGAAVYSLVEGLFSAFTEGNSNTIGDAEEAAAWTFALGSIAPVFETTGGDYGVVADWASIGGGGGGCGGDPDGCPIEL